MQHGAPLSLLAEPPFSHRAGWCGVIKLTLSPTLDNVLLIHLLCSGKTPLNFWKFPMIIRSFHPKRKHIFRTSRDSIFGHPAQMR